MQYFRELLKMPRITAFFKEMNRGGKLNAIIPIPEGTESEKIGKILTGWFFYSAKLGKYPLLSFDNWFKNRK
jgi:hypothetical protein